MNVYFMKTGDAIKIGIASDISRRMIEVQVGNPNKIELLHSIDTTEQDARKIEAHIHELFHKTNLNGEWFQANQFMIEFIQHIKLNGWESHSLWIEKQYQEVYGDILDSLKTKIEKDIIKGNLVSLDKLKFDLGKLVNEIFMIPSLPVNMTEAIRKWIDRRKEPFVLLDLYNEFGISTRNGKKHISTILKRLLAENRLERQGSSPKCIYKRRCVD